MHSVTGTFWDRLPVIAPADFTMLLVTVIVAVLVAILIVATTVFKIHKSRLDDALKRDLLDRGLSADEIATIIGAKSNKCGSRLSAQR
jgi:hypothetical protein